MKRYLVYPEGYSPEIASGPPTPFLLEIGCNWTPEDTEKMKELEKGAEIHDHVIYGRACLEITCGMCQQHGYKSSLCEMDENGEPDVPNCGVCYCDEHEPACDKFKLKY
ncbi:MAG: hypothetical protein WC444_04470 [Candidatus Paceibacterota bacterium]